MDIEECLRKARIAWENELRYIDDMIREGDVAEDETFTMRKLAYQDFEKRVKNCYQEFEGRSTPGSNRY